MYRSYNIKKQFGPRLNPTKCRAWFGSKLFGTRMVLLKIILCFWKKSLFRGQNTMQNVLYVISILVFVSKLLLVRKQNIRLDCLKTISIQLSKPELCYIPSCLKYSITFSGIKNIPREINEKEVHVLLLQLSQCRRFPTMWYVRPAKPQISLRIRAVWSEPLQVAWVFYDC